MVIGEMDSSIGVGMNRDYTSWGGVWWSGRDKAYTTLAWLQGDFLESSCVGLRVGRCHYSSGYRRERLGIAKLTRREAHLAE